MSVLAVTVAVISIPLAVAAIALMLGTLIEIVTAGRVSFGLGDGQRRRRDLNEGSR